MNIQEFKYEIQLYGHICPSVAHSDIVVTLSVLMQSRYIYIYSCDLKSQYSADDSPNSVLRDQAHVKCDYFTN
jgi:hypothetical protein